MLPYNDLFMVDSLPLTRHPKLEVSNTATTVSGRGYKAIRREFWSRINKIYYGRYFFTTYEYYNYLQLIKLFKTESITTDD